MTFIITALRCTCNQRSRTSQVGPSVQLRWRTLSRALWALSLRALLAFIDYIGALALLTLATGKLWAFDLACVVSATSLQAARTL